MNEKQNQQKQAHDTVQMKLWANKKPMFFALALFVLAFSIRLIYVYESSANPTFNTPVVDAYKYHTIAQELAQEGKMGSGFFWQPFFYPFFLSIVYYFSGSSILWAKIIQAFLGGLTSLLTYYLGKKLFDFKTGVLAGVIIAFYGPLFFFETELLGSGWATFWSIPLLLAFLSASAKKTFWRCFLLGTCGALSILARPTFVLFFLAGCLWLAFSLFRSRIRRPLPVRQMVGILAGFALIATPVAIQSFRVTGHFGILPASGGVNFYVGNNPGYAETLAARPGYDWLKIIDLPKESGLTGDWSDQQRFFYRKVMDFAFDEPAEFAKGLAHKTIQFISSREIPRNVDIYLFGKWSYLLDLLTWEISGFGFPFGLILPLALLGLVFHWRQVPTPVLLFLLFYPVSIIVVFIAGRYRLPIIPVMSVLAAAGLITLIEIIRMNCWARLAIVAVCGLGVILLSSLPGPFLQEHPHTEADMYYGVGCLLEEQGQIDQAVALFAQAAQLDPNYAGAPADLGAMLAADGQNDQAIVCYTQALHFDPKSAEIHISLGNAHLQQGQFDLAIKHLTEAITIKPGYANIHNNLGNALTGKNQVDEAIRQFRQALRLDPNHYSAHNNLGVALLEKKNIDEAIEEFRQALRLKPTYAKAHNNLAKAFYRQHRQEEAVAHWSQAVRLRPNWAEPHNNLAWVLATAQDVKLRNPSEAVRLAQLACELTDNKRPAMLDTLATAYAAGERFPDAVLTARKAVALALSLGKKELAQSIQDRLKLYQTQQPYQPSE